MKKKQTKDVLKNFDFNVKSLKDADSSNGPLVLVGIAAREVPDMVGEYPDLTTTKFVREEGIPMLFNHNVDQPIGLVKEISRDNGELKVELIFNPHLEAAREFYKSAKEGFITGLSGRYSGGSITKAGVIVNSLLSEVSLCWMGMDTGAKVELMKSMDAKGINSEALAGYIVETKSVEEDIKETTEDIKNEEKIINVETKLEETEKSVESEVETTVP